VNWNKIILECVMCTMKLECTCISRHANSECLVNMWMLDMHMAYLWDYNSLLLYTCNTDVILSMTNDGLCIQKKKNSMVKRWMMLLHMNSIYVKTHEGGSNGDQKDVGGSLWASKNTNWSDNIK